MCPPGDGETETRSQAPCAGQHTLPKRGLLRLSAGEKPYRLLLSGQEIVDMIQAKSLVWHNKFDAIVRQKAALRRDNHVDRDIFDGKPLIEYGDNVVARVVVVQEDQELFLHAVNLCGDRPATHRTLLATRRPFSVVLSWYSICQSGSARSDAAGIKFFTDLGK